MDKKLTKIPGCFEINCFHQSDHRGVFVKHFSQSQFSKDNLEVDFKEGFFTSSKYKVIRGLHFQAPPFSVTKLVYCVEGIVFDVIVDLRDGSPTYLQWDAVKLDSNLANSVYIPSGCAHGFAVLSKNAILGYMTSGEYQKHYDLGIRWDSLSIQWPFKKPILSERDQMLPLLNEFKSPFKYVP